MEKLFIPLTLDTQYWDYAKEKLFLDEVYSKQLSNKELCRVKYSILPQYESTIDCEIINEFSKKIIGLLVPLLNEYQKTRFSEVYWRKMLYKWLVLYVTDIFCKVEHLSKAQELFPHVRFSSIVKPKEKRNKYIYGVDYIGNFYIEDYNFYVYSLLAERYYDFKLEYCFREQSKNITIEKKKENVFINRMKKFFSASTLLDKILYRYFLWKGRKNVRVLYYLDDFPAKLKYKLTIKSCGKIQPMRIDYLEFQKKEIDYSIRNKIQSQLSKCECSEKWQLVVLDLVSGFMPAVYLEQYNELKQQSEDYLQSKSKLKAIFTGVGVLNNSIETFCSMIAQTEGVKIIGQQHGGDYGLLCNVDYSEKNIDNVFYGWGSWVDKVENEKCFYYRAPTYKFFLYNFIKTEKIYILYGGTAIFAYDRYIDFIHGATDNRQYIQQQVDFFEAIEKTVFKQILIRNYYRDFGWNLNEILRNKFSDIKLSSELNLDTNADNYINGRNKSFTEELAKCKLYICDHISTTWLEALYIDKPLLILLRKGQYEFREEEKKYIHLMEKAGIIQYDIKKAANLVNSIYNDVDKWWYEPERQEIVKIIRERYLTYVSDIDQWWLDEFKTYVEGREASE